MAEKEICNTRLLNWTYTDLEAFLAHSQKPKFGHLFRTYIDLSLANLPHCVTNLDSNLLSGISIFQILYLILASFKGAFILSPTFRIYHVPKLQRKIRRHHFSTNLTYANLWHFSTFATWVQLKKLSEERWIFNTFFKISFPS